ncbi:MAG: extracellular solute-binding protein [Chloroflexota bacterium]
MKYRLAVVLICLLFTACITVGNATEELNDSLLIWHNWPAPESQLIDEIIGRFQETHPRVEITTEYVPSHQFAQRFIDRASSGLDPDVIIGIEPFLLYELAERELLRDLGEMDLRTENLLPKSMEALNIDGAQVAVPFSAYTNVLFFNKSTVTRPAESLDELMAAAENGSRVAIPTDFYHAYWGIHAFGGVLIAEDGTLVEDKAFEHWLHFLDNAQSEPNILLNHIYQDLYQAFATGNADYFIGNSIDLPYLEETLGEGNVGVMRLPGQRRSVGAGSFLELETMAVSVNASEAQAELATELINFFTNPTQQRRIALSNYGQSPLHQGVNFDERLAPITAVLIEQGKQSIFFPLEFTKKIDQLRIVGTETYIQVLEGIISPQEALPNLMKTVSESQLNADLDPIIAAQIHPIERSSEVVNVANTALLFDMIRKANIYLNRSIVQVQLVSILIGLSLAWTLAEILRFLVPRINLFLYGRPWIHSWLRKVVDEEEAAKGVISSSIRQLFSFLFDFTRAITFPIFGFLILLWFRNWLLSQGALAGLLLKMEWVLGAILVYCLAAALLRQILDLQTARTVDLRYLRPAFFVGLGLAILHNLADLFVVAEIILTNLFNSPITVRALFLATVGLYLWFGLIRIIQDILYRLITAFTSYNPGDVKSSLTLFRYLFILVGVGYVFTQFQFDTTTMAAITGGLSVGVGFALREILGNFIGGVILLFERSLHPGDVIEVDNQLSIVDRFNIRSTTVRTKNNEEIVIPNQTFLISSIKTLPYTNSHVRVGFTVQTDCAINPVEVSGLIKSAGEQHPQVLDKPAPEVILLDYGNNVASFRLNVWIPNAMLGEVILSDIRLKIWNLLKENNVSLPFPEIELHFPKEMVKPRQDGLPVI